MRLNLDGSLPNDNPFIDDDKINDAVWSYGHRNPQGLVFDRDRNILWEVEHGPRGGDEINIIKKVRITVGQIPLMVKNIGGRLMRRMQRSYQALNHQLKSISLQLHLALQQFTKATCLTNSMALCSLEL